MSQDNNELYQSVILEHNRRPRHFGRIPTATHAARGYNPLCGDRYEISLILDEQGKISDCMFEGQGCAISKASASLMTEAVLGKSSEEALDIFDRFHKMISGQRKEERDIQSLGKLRVFSNLWQYPARVKCAGLSWHALKGALGNEHDISTE